MEQTEGIQALDLSVRMASGLGGGASEESLHLAQSHGDWMVKWYSALASLFL